MAGDWFGVRTDYFDQVPRAGFPGGLRLADLRARSRGQSEFLALRVLRAGGPIRFVNSLLQANFGGATRELGRFMLNTTAGIGGLFDPASHPDINIAKQDEDFGQTLGVYGVGQGIFINWPILGPSSPRDTLGLVGDYFLHPFFYYDGPWLIPWELRVYEKVNDTSLRIGDYEALKGAAIDPYVAIRDAYVQYRLKKVREK